MSRSETNTRIRLTTNIPYSEAKDFWDDLGESVLEMSKLRLEIETTPPHDTTTYLMTDMESPIDSWRVAELEPWMVERLSLLYLVHDRMNVPGVGYRYNDHVFYIETDPTYYEQKDTEA